MKYERLTLRTVHGEVQQLTTRAGILDRLADLEDKIESGQLVELPCVAMIEQGLIDGKFKPTNEAQHFNGRYAVVYFDKTKLKKPLIDICWCEQCTYDPYQAEARLKELQGE